MDYTEIEEAGRLELIYDGPPLDLRTLGHLQLELHQIIDDIAFATLLEDRVLRDYILFERFPLSPRRLSLIQRHYPKMLRGPWFHERWMLGPDYPETPYDVPLVRTTTPYDVPLVRTTCHRAEVGSWYQELGFAAALILTNPDVRASLQGLGGNILYAMLNSGLRGVEVVKGKIRDHKPRGNVETPPTYDPYDIGPNLMNVAKHLVDNGGSDAKSLTIKHKIKDGESEVQIRLR